MYGMARADPDVASSLWQVQRVVYLPALVFLFQAGFRTARDGLAMGKVVVAAACLKALLAIYIRATVPPPAGEPFLQYATTHADSMLFSVAFCAVLTLADSPPRVPRLSWSRWCCRCSSRAWSRTAGAWPGWSSRGAFSRSSLLTPWSAAKRAFIAGRRRARPLLLAYAAIGWGSESSIFRPIHTLRSVVDSKADPSTMWRDLENYDLFFTLRHSPMLGTGYGHGYVEIVWLPDISSDVRALPHSCLTTASWASGPTAASSGFTALWTMLVVGLFLGARAYRHATAVDDRRRVDRRRHRRRVPRLLLRRPRARHLDQRLPVAPALAIASRLAVATGAWPTVRADAAGRPAPCQRRRGRHNRVADIRT